MKDEILGLSLVIFLLKNFAWTELVPIWFGIDIDIGKIISPVWVSVPVSVRIIRHVSVSVSLSGLITLYLYDTNAKTDTWYW